MSPDDQLDDMALRLRFDIWLLRATVNTISHFRHSPHYVCARLCSTTLSEPKPVGYRNGWYMNDAGSNDIANVG